MRPNEARTPPGGWHYPADPKVRLETHDKKTLIDRLFEFRLRNGLPTGDEEKDIDSYICSKWPTACNREASDYGHPPQKNKHEILLNRVTRWAAGLIDTTPRGGYVLISRSEMEKRAVVCRACPKNLSWRTGCRGCSASTVSLLMQVRKLQRAPEGLMGCEILGYDCSTAVFLPRERLAVTESQRSILPDACWLKNA